MAILDPQQPDSAPVADPNTDLAADLAADLTADIVRRKADHIQLALNQGSQIGAAEGFDAYTLEHQALPELDLQAIDLSTQAFGKSLAAPLLIGSMTGGLEQGARINRHLAEAAQALGLGMGLGSQRVTFEHPETLASFKVRAYAPDILLLANLGAVQLNKGFEASHCQQAVSSVGADGLYLHLNPLQEAIQAEGDTEFGGLSQRIAEVCAQLQVPVLVKECGNGISGATARRLQAAGVQAIEVSGRGGTSWAWIEAQRNPDPRMKRLGKTFAHWGLTTPQSLLACRQAAPELLLIGAGGIRSGLDAAKAIALGADLVSIAQPLLAPALESTEAVIAELQLFLLELRIAMFCAGAKDLAALRQLGVSR